MAKIKFEHCTYSDGHCHDFEAIQVRWADLKAAGFSGDGSDSDEIVAALLASGAPAWVQDAGGWVDEIGWGLIGPQLGV